MCGGGGTALLADQWFAGSRWDKIYLPGGHCLPVGGRGLWLGGGIGGKCDGNWIATGSLELRKVHRICIPSTLAKLMEDAFRWCAARFLVKITDQWGYKYACTDMKSKD